MRLILEVISGPFQGRRIKAEVGQIVRIGRTTKADIALEDNFMSGEHFSIQCNFRSCQLKDLNSRNGTQVNGETVAEAILNDGDRVHAGRTDFIIKIEDPLRTVSVSLPGIDDEAKSEAPNPESVPPPPEIRKESKRIPPEAKTSRSTERKPLSLPTDQPQPPPPGVVPKVVEARSIPSTASNVESIPLPEISIDPPPDIEPVAPVVIPTPQPELAPNALQSYEAATPAGRLLNILSSQPGSLMALVDAAHDAKVLELLRGAPEEYKSLYRSEQKAAIVPYLVRLPPQSDLLKQMIQQGWGHEWGVYLTCSLSLPGLREFFRTSLMVTMPDGTELFSRFYDPRFFRTFLETCSAPEAEKFFGPITAYFMEDERPEILLQFSRSKRGAEKKGHLLSVLG